MTLFSYEIFDAVARQGSFNKAAQQLHLTPSAISHAIAVTHGTDPRDGVDFEKIMEDLL